MQFAWDISTILCVTTLLVFLPIFIILVTLFILNRKSALIEKRHFELTLIGHCFSILSFIFFMGFQIDFRTQVVPCLFYKWLTWLIPSGYSLAYLFRAWYVYFYFKLNESKAILYDDILDSVEIPFTSFFIRNQYFYNKKGLLYLYLLTFGILQIIFIIIVASLNLWHPTCSIVSTFEFFVAIVFGIEIVIGIVFAFLLFRIKENYGLKLEFKALVIIISILFIIWIILVSMNVSEMYVNGIEKLYVVGLGPIFTILLSAGFPLWLVYKEKRMKQKKLKRIELKDILNNENTRKEFMNFLISDFSVENLLFWQSVETYKSLPNDKLESEAKKIYATFIEEGSPNQINIDFFIYEEIASNLEKGIYFGLYDSAQHSIFELMNTSSFLRYSLNLSSKKPVELELFPENNDIENK